MYVLGILDLVGAKFYRECHCSTPSPDAVAASGTGARVGAPATPRHLGGFDGGGGGTGGGGGVGGGGEIVVRSRTRLSAATRESTDASRMCGKKKLLMLMTSLCACAAFASLCIAVATDYWIHCYEKIHDTNLTDPYRHSYLGLWHRCDIEPFSGRRTCKYISYFYAGEKGELGPTEAVEYSMRRATLFPLISLFILLVAGMISFVGHCNQKRKMLTFVSGILFVIAGLCTLIGIIIYIGAVSGEVGSKANKKVDQPPFRYYYGIGFMLTVGSFIISELCGVFSVYLYISRHKHDFRKKQERLNIMEVNERPHSSRYRRSRSHSRERNSRDHSQNNSPSHSDSYFTYTPVSDTSREMSNYTSFSRDHSRHTLSTTADAHMSRDYSVHSGMDSTMRRTTPV